MDNWGMAVSRRYGCRDVVVWVSVEREGVGGMLCNMSQNFGTLRHPN